VSGNEKSRLLIVQFKQEYTVENIILHPDFVFKHASHEHDLAVIKIRPNIQINGFEDFRIACLPEFDEDPVEDCQIANYFPNENDSSKVHILINWFRIWIFDKSFE
jgi:hypothetical protein